MRALLAVPLLIASLMATAADLASYPGEVLDTTAHVLTAPLHWQAPEWRRAGESVLAVLGAATLDRAWRDEMRRHGSNDPTIKQVERLGAEYAPLVIGSFWLAGQLHDDAEADQTARDALSASFIASGLVTTSIKLMVGRARPRDQLGVAHFAPLSEPNASFPSGHTTEAFALASVISAHYDADWVRWTSYGLASGVGLARTYHDAHFLSDVVAGALIGHYVGRAVVAHHSGTPHWQPLAAPGLLGVQYTQRF
ncbi:MAG: hypothetical protein Fur0040_09640 [Sideroxydans sp.]